MRCSGAHNAQPMGGKTFHTQKTPPSLWEESPTTWRCSWKIHCIPCRLRIQPRKFTFSKFAHFLICVLQKFHPKKKKQNPQVVHLTKISHQKNGSLQTISHQTWNDNQLLNWTKKTGRLCNYWTFQAIWSPTSSWWIRFLGETPICWGKFQLWGLVWFDWLVGVVGWLKWLSPPSGLVEVVWLWWSCNLQGLFGPAKDSTRNGNGWQDMSEGNFWRGQKSCMALFCWLYPNIQLKPRNFGTSFLCPPISIWKYLARKDESEMLQHPSMVFSSHRVLGKKEGLSHSDWPQDVCLIIVWFLQFKFLYW